MRASFRRIAAVAHPRTLKRVAAALGVAAVLLAALVIGSRLLRPAPDRWADIRQSWGPAFSMTDAQLRALPAYSITAQINLAARAYTGTLELTLPISASAPLNELYFRTYPQVFVFGGDLQVTGARIDGVTVNFLPEREKLAVRIAPVKPLEPGKTVEVWLSFVGALPAPRDPGSYSIFGESEEILSLTNFYPILAGRRDGAWALDNPHPQGDVGFHDAALYQVNITAPVTETVVAPGAQITRTLTAEGWATTRYAIGPAREFTALLSPAFQALETEAAGVRVRSYFVPQDAEAAKSALYDAVAALQVYSSTFGAYPYRDMAIVEAPLNFHGMEFPAISLIGSQVYDEYLQDLENLVVHEVAHQWWYNQVGSDQVATPWLDEGLAEFSMYMYALGRYGVADAEQLRTQRWAIPVAALVDQGADRPIGLPVRDYTENYETLIYGKGALFFATLRDRLGPLVFERLLRTYIERYRWRIATPAEFQALAEEVSGQELAALFAEWVGSNAGGGQ